MASAETRHTPEPWRIVTARVPHRCTKNRSDFNGCGREIKVGERYAKSIYRTGLDHLEACLECAAIAKAEAV